MVDDAETYLGEKVEEVIVSVPAYFNDAQRYATKLAGKFAGVQIDRIINEPSAAALAKRSMVNQEDQSFIVVDFGGGTLGYFSLLNFLIISSKSCRSQGTSFGRRRFTAAIAEEFLVSNQLTKDTISREYYSKNSGTG